MTSDRKKPGVVLAWAEFWRKFTAYACIFVGFVGAITPVHRSLPISCAVNLTGIACIIGGIWWLIRLRRRFD